MRQRTGRHCTVRSSWNVAILGVRAHTGGMAHDVCDVTLFMDSMKQVSHWTSCVNSYVLATVIGITCRDLGELLVVLIVDIKHGDIQPGFGRISALIVDITPKARSG